MGIHAQGVFGSAEGTIKNAGVGGPGVVMSADGGAFRLVFRQAPGFVRIPLGVLGAAVGVLAVAIGATLLESEAGIDLMGYRKGPLMVGMLGLFAALGGWAALTWLARALFGREVVKEVTSLVAQPHGRNDKGLVLLWSEDGQAVGATFVPHDGSARQELLALRRAAA